MKNNLKKLLFKIKVLVCNLFNLSYVVDNLPVRRIISRYANANEYSFLPTITEVETIKKRDLLTVRITSHRPGLLIGVHGKTIDKMKSLLELDLNEKVYIDIKESYLWHHLYK